MFPIQNFELIAVAITKYKNTAIKGGVPKLLGNNHRQTINGFTHIGHPRCKIDLVNGNATDHAIDRTNSSKGFSEDNGVRLLIVRLKPLVWDNCMVLVSEVDFGDGVDNVETSCTGMS